MPTSSTFSYLFKMEYQHKLSTPLSKHGDSDAWCHGTEEENEVWSWWTWKFVNVKFANIVVMHFLVMSGFCKILVYLFYNSFFMYVNVFLWSLTFDCDLSFSTFASCVPLPRLGLILLGLKFWYFMVVSLDWFGFMSVMILCSKIQMH